MKPSWYAVQTKPRAEQQALWWVRRRAGAAIFLPQVEVRRRRRGRLACEIEPLFPSYFFVHMALSPWDWHAVKWSPGVKGIVSTGAVPVPVPDRAIELLQDACPDGVLRWRPTVAPGTEVRVKAGPFEGLIGVLERPTSRPERVRVLLTLMGARVAVEVDVVDVEGIPNARAHHGATIAPFGV